jgi:predicted double-glycine peptidase
MPKLLIYKQKNNWTCGPACMLVVLDYFGTKKDIGSLLIEMRTTKKEGTHHSDIINLLKTCKLQYLVKRNCSIHDIKKHLCTNLVIVGYWIPYYKESHYSIVKKVNSSRIYFHDTWFGPKHNCTIDYFLRNWWDDEAKGWMIAIKRPM